MELFGIVRLCLCDFYLTKMGKWGDEKEEGGYTLNNLITSLLLFINNPEVRDTDYQIASSRCMDLVVIRFLKVSFISMFFPVIIK